MSYQRSAEGEEDNTGRDGKPETENKRKERRVKDGGRNDEKGIETRATEERGEETEGRGRREADLPRKFTQPSRSFMNLKRMLQK